MPDTPANIVELGFGQTEPLTVRLHGLIRNYPKGVGIIKEFIQNSDDAGARRVEIIMDWRRHDAEQLPAAEMKALNGPALLVFNDQTFTDDDFRSIQEIGQSGKSRTIAKTGRFGFGFNASYNITDYPGFISNDSIAFFDPHQNVIPQAKQGHGLGGRWKLTETFWQQYPDLLSPFFAGGLKQGETHFNGTIFRLPLRTEEQASNSQICSEPFTEDDFQRILQQLSVFGSELLLFLKHVLFIQVSEISSDGKKRVVLDLSSNNCDEVVRHRTQLNSAAANEYDLLHNLRNSNDDNAPKVSYRHAITVNSDKGQEYHLWRIVNGFYNDEHDRVLDAAADMLVHDEKAVPWVGAAARLEHDMDTHRLVPTPIEGRLYCSLPLQEPTQLPVHINGFFDLDSSRQSLTADRSLVGKDACRVHWNEMLIEHSLSRAYVHLLEELTADCSAKEVDAYYKLWPNADQPPSGLLEKLPLCVYQQATAKQIVHSCREQQPWTTISAVSLAPESWEAIQEPLIADDMLLPRPALPTFIVRGYEKAAVDVNWLTPATVREHLYVDEDINLPLAEVSRPCLTNREWLVLLLRFCISDNPGREIEGLPLALLADGKLHTFGETKAATLFLAEPEEQQIFATLPDWFIDDDFAAQSGLTPSPAAGLERMTPDSVVANLHLILDPNSTGSPLPWHHTNTSPPNAQWLASVYRYLTERKGARFKPDEATLYKLPIVPDQYGMLWRAGAADTPLMLSAEDDGAMREVLEQLAIPIVSGPEALVNSINHFTASYPDTYIWPVTGRDLVDALDSTLTDAQQANQTYNPATHGKLLDFLSQPRWLEGGENSVGVRIEQLKKLPIFPTIDGTLVAIDSNTYIPDDYSPPAVAAEIHLLQTGHDGQWSDLYKLLGVPKLDRATFIEAVLLPAYAALETSQQYATLVWIRDNFSRVETELEARSKSAAAKFQRLIAHAPLIRCNDGSLHAATEIYDPRQADISAILGAGAAFPLRSIYEQSEAHWFTFFGELGMSAVPRAEDLIKTIDNLIDDARIECSTNIKQRLQRLFSYLDEHWETWHNATVHNPPEGGKSTSLIEALSRRAWLPAIQGGERYPGFIAPADRLYRPAEIYPPTLGNLVASQQPVAALCTPSAAITEALQFATQATIDTVSRHFDQLLALASQPQDHSATENIEKALTAVYQYFGAIQNDGELDKLKTRYQGKPCVWHPTQQKLWAPKNIFKTPVAFFEPRRTDLRAEGTDHDRGIAALGRRQAPSIEDYIEFLQETQSAHGSEPLPDNESRQVLQVLRHLGTDLVQQHRSVALNRLVVLSAANRLVSAAAGYIADAPWYESRFSSEQVHLLHSETEYNLIKAANLKRLSQHVVEKLIDRPTPSENTALSQLCKKWQDTIRGLEFRAGLIRLIRHRHGFDQCYELNWLPELSVVAVQSIHAEFWMSDPLEQRQILVGVGESEYYLDSDEGVIYMRGQATDLMGNFLARAINQRLGAQQLEDLAPLVVILNTPRQYTQDVLTQFRISRYENEVNDVNFPENIEADSSFEEDLIKESNNPNSPAADQD